MRPMRALSAVLLFSAAAFAQTNKGGISGAVTDQNGAAIPGAAVTVTNAGTGQKQTVTTTESGAFSVQSLDPVVYSVAVEAQGFKRALVESVKVDTATVVSVNVELQTGTVEEQITVVADAPLINTESGVASTTVTERQIQDVPLNNRSVLDLAVTAPGVTGDAGSEDPGPTGDQPVPGFNLSVNGGRPGSTAILADGVNNTGVGIARSVVSFTPETVQEFTVQTSAFSAEYGTTGGGTINVFNHPNFRFVGTGNTPPGFGTFPTELTGETQGGVTQPITIAQYNAWANAWNATHPNDLVPLQSTAAGAPINPTLQRVRDNVNAVRLPPRPGSVNGALPLDFFRTRIPQGFATATPESFDIRTLEGFKLFRLRQTYDTNFGTLTPVSNPRYIQFGIRIFF